MGQQIIGLPLALNWICPGHVEIKVTNFVEMPLNSVTVPCKAKKHRFKCTSW